jgi:electron transfer flavoprotein beta subunit
MARQIVVCVTATLGPDSPLPFEPERPSATCRLLNPADQYAIEEALRLRDVDPTTRITGLTVGPPEADAILRSCFVAGVDAAVRAWDGSLAGADTLATAKALAAAVRRLAGDLVLCGLRAGDGNTGVTSIQLSELLSWPLVLEAGALELRDGLLYAERRESAGRRALVRCPLPAVAAIAPGSNRPRYPRLRDRLRAHHRPIEPWGGDRVGLAPEAPRLRLERLGPPKPKTKGLLAVDSALSAEERWQAVIGGGVPAGGQQEEQQRLVRGSPQEQAEHFVRLLGELDLR